MTFKISTQEFWDKVKDSEIIRKMDGHISDVDLSGILGLHHVKTFYAQNSDTTMFEFYIVDERLFLLSKIKYGL